MATIDQQFVEYIVKTLVNNPDAVSVERTIDEKGVLLTLTVDPSDVGRVIGKRGVTAQSIRMLLRALGTKQDARYNLKIVNTDEENGGVEGAKRDWHDGGKDSDDEAKMVVESMNSSDEPEAESEEGDDSSELAEKTRAELADLDDLDI